MKKLSRLSLKGMNAQPRKGAVEKDHPVIVATIYGRAHKVGLVRVSFGDVEAFSGEFEGVNANGDVWASKSLLLPDEQTTQLLSDALKAVEEGQSVEFGFEYKAVHHETSKVGYLYEARALTPFSPADPLATLRHAIAGKVGATPERKAEPDKSATPPKAPGKNKI